MNAQQSPDIRKLVSRLMKLQRQIESTAVPSEKPGYLANRFGTFDRVDLSDKLFEMFGELLKKAPTEEYFKFLLAAALARVNKLTEAEAEYEALRQANGQYAEASALMLAGVQLQLGKRKDAEASLDDYNGRVEHRGKQFLKRRLEDIEIEAP
jgi:predicted Zn-dependent protease